MSSKIVPMTMHNIIEAMHFSMRNKDIYPIFSAFDPAEFIRIWLPLMDAGEAVGWLVMTDEDKAVGTLIGRKIYHPVTGLITAVKQLWFIEPEYRKHGVRMLDLFIAWAKNNGCETVSVNTMYNDEAAGIERVLERKRFAPTFKTFTLDLRS